MRKVTAAVIVSLLLASAGSAQYKAKPKPKAAPAPLQVSGASQEQVALDSVRRVSHSEAYKLQKEGKAVIVDVRSFEQYQLGHIKGAVSIPGSQLLSRLRELPPRTTIITYCACSAEQSSGKAVINLNAHGVQHAAAMTGGWAAWRAAGLPTAAGPN
jgi:rhodanese-related sulfurtransferase